MCHLPYTLPLPTLYSHPSTYMYFRTSTSCNTSFGQVPCIERLLLLLLLISKMDLQLFSQKKHLVKIKYEGLKIIFPWWHVSVSFSKYHHESTIRAMKGCRVFSSGPDMIYSTLDIDGDGVIAPIRHVNPAVMICYGLRAFFPWLVSVNIIMRVPLDINMRPEGCTCYYGLWPQHNKT